MLRFIILLLFAFLWFPAARAQARTDIQWASELVRFSSQYSRKQSSASQILGPPRVFPASGPSDVAWAPARENSPVDEYVRVRFARPQRVGQVVIGENLNPGAIYRIVLYDTQGKKHVVYENRSNEYSFQPGGRMFRHEIEITDYRVAELKLVLRTNRIPGMSQIDAIGISEAAVPYIARIPEVEPDLYPAAPESLGEMVNSEVPDMLPMISPDGRTLYFARKLHPDNVVQTLPDGRMRLSDDVWMSELQDDGTWAKAVRMGARLNNERHNFVSWISPDGKQILLPHDYDQPEIGSEFRVSLAQRLREPVGDPIRGFEDWSRPQTLRVKNLTNQSEFTCIHMDPSGRVLLFALEREDGMGGLDLYVSFRETGPGQGFLGRLQTGERWTEPRSLGATINTAGMEGSVFLAADGKALYFSSDGRSGYGGFDMYLSRRLDDSWTNWSEPLNLGPTINSGRDEYYYTIPATGDYAYFSSDLSGNSDIYRIRLPKAARPDPVTLVQASLDGNKPKVGARFRVSQFDENHEKVSEQLAEDGEDQVAFIVPGSIGSSLMIEADGFFPVYRSLGPRMEEGVDYDPEDSDGEAQARVDEVWTAAYRDSLKQALLDSILPAVRAEFEDKMRAEAPKSSSVQAELEDRLKKEIEAELRAVLSSQIRRDLEGKLQDSLDRIKPSSEPLEIAAGEERIIEDGVDDILRDDPDSGEEVYQDVVQDIRMVPLEAGQTVRLDNVYFAANKAYLRKDSKEELLMVADFLKAHGELVVEIGGHTNGLPGADFCQKLSAARSKRVVDFLIEEGVRKDRLQAKGYGKANPIASNETIEGRKQNQRVEIKILEVRN